mmetsp:Transcript_8662/g.19836  ORF Transcript_8662/g.19836 Transcript_8662/m.19836 type:complete len:251 (-) Transcript_8662:139-891(-)
MYQKGRKRSRSCTHTQMARLRVHGRRYFGRSGASPQTGLDELLQQVLDLGDLLGRVLHVALQLRDALRGPVPPDVLEHLVELLGGGVQLQDVAAHEYAPRLLLRWWRHWRRHRLGGLQLALDRHHQSVPKHRLVAHGQDAAPQTGHALVPDDAAPDLHWRLRRGGDGGLLEDLRPNHRVRRQRRDELCDAGSEADERRGMLTGCLAILAHPHLQHGREAQEHRDQRIRHRRVDGEDHGDGEAPVEVPDPA